MEEIDEVIKHIPEDKDPVLMVLMVYSSKNAGISLARMFTTFVRNFTMDLLIYSPLIMHS
jgi:hypothetical protein